MLTAPSPNELVNLFHQGTRLTFDKGESIIRPGISPPGLFYIVSGLVKAYDITKYGEENLLIMRKAGEILGLTTAITGEEREVHYAALAPTTTLRISHDLFTNYLRDHPAAALPLVDMLAEMYRLHSERIMNLGYRSVRERLASFLLSTMRRFGQPNANGTVTIGVPLRHQDIGSSISASRETAGRELAVLERQGLISAQQSTITLLDIPGLRRYVE